MSLMPYGLIKKILFMFDPETAHSLSLQGLNLLYRVKLIAILFGSNKVKSVRVMGIDFPNPVGLAAGLDKNGEYFQALSQCGFGFVEIGTVTPVSQTGNEKPRLFRLQAAEAIINRMGFNNQGVDYLVDNVKCAGFNGVLGINIGKNKNTPEASAVDDYLICLQKVYPHADYVTINISSPNTPGLRDLQYGDSLQNLLKGLKQKQAELEKQYKKYVPLVVKVAPDMDEETIEQVSTTLLEFAIDGVIVSNTTLSREGVEHLLNGNQQGGLSGRPLKDKADYSLKMMAIYLKGKIPIIAVGGISQAADAADKMALGASLVQIYTGFIYQGPGLVHACVEAI